MTQPKGDRRFRYQTEGAWYKGNTHIHSTVSDGGKTFSELAEMYSGAGYDFLFRTDHRVASDVSADTQDYPLLWLDGIELDGEDQTGSSFHVVCLGRFTGIDKGTAFVDALNAAREQGGVRILAHPLWTGNSVDDALRWSFDGIEIYNHVCRWLNGKGCGMAHWNAVMERSPNTLAIAADDVHLRPEHITWNGGWIVVNAPACAAENVMAAIRSGNYYSSMGPSFESITCEGSKVRVTTSPVRYVRLAGKGWQGDRIMPPEAGTVREAEFEIPEDWKYAYIEIEDEAGRHAWTNSLFSV